MTSFVTRVTLKVTYVTSDVKNITFKVMPRLTRPDAGILPPEPEVISREISKKFSRLKTKKDTKIIERIVYAIYCSIDQLSSKVFFSPAKFQSQSFAPWFDFIDEELLLLHG